jgi:hypothetical protein
VCRSDDADRQMLRSLQDTCSRLVEAHNSIVGWQLEHTTWLKRTLVVKSDNIMMMPPSTPSSPMCMWFLF